MEQAENKVVKTKRELALDRLKGKYPEMDFAEDEVIFGRINDDYEDYDKQLADYEEREGKLSKMFAADPRAAAMLMKMRDGEDPALYLVRQFGDEIKAVIDDPERQEEIAEANKEFVERVAKEQEYEKEYTANLEASLAYLDELQGKTGMSDEDIDKTMEYLVTIVKDGVMGKFSPEAIDLARKALHYDADVAQAAHEGEVKGRNEKIEEKLRKRNASDGTASLDGKTTAVRKPANVSMGALDKYDNNLSIFERGGEKRTKY